MPSYTVNITDEQQLALEYDTEQRNSMPSPVPPGSPQPPPLTPQDVLQQSVAQHLDMLGHSVQSVIAPLEQMLLNASPEGREGLIAGLERKSLQNFLRRRR